MSDEEIYKFKTTIPGAEWWYHAAAICVLANLTEHEKFNIDDVTEQGAVVTITGIVGTEEEDDRRVSIVDTIATFELTSKGGTTVITGHRRRGMQERWTTLLKQLRGFASEARDVRRLAFGKNPEAAIEYYYRSRAQGNRITLKEISSISGYSESHLKRTKAAYDKAGKWGSRKKE